MNIHLVQPCGFCNGVNKVLEKSQQIIDDYPSAHIYFIGNVIHNDLVCQQLLKNPNVKILDNKEHDRVALVKSIKTENNVLIFSAHGTDPRAINIAEEKGWKVFDLTCPFVMNILTKIQSAILHGYHVAYFGDKNHPEAIAAKAVGGVNLTVYRTKDDLKKVLDLPYVQVVAQTTMDEQEYLATQPWFTEPAKIKFSNTICHSSRQRQHSVEELKPYDVVFVLTDPESHNGNELVNKLKTRQNNVIAINPKQYHLTKAMIENKKNCAVLSSSSVSQQQIDKFLLDLKSIA